MLENLEWSWQLVPCLLQQERAWGQKWDWEHWYPKGFLLIPLWVFAHSHQEGIGFKCRAAEHPLVMSLPSLFVEVKCLYLAHPRLLSWKWLYWHIHSRAALFSTEGSEGRWVRKEEASSQHSVHDICSSAPSSSWKAQGCWMSCFELILKELCRTIPDYEQRALLNITKHRIPCYSSCLTYSCVLLISTSAEQSFWPFISSSWEILCVPAILKMVGKKTCPFEHCSWKSQGLFRKYQEARYFPPTTGKRGVF